MKLLSGTQIIHQKLNGPKELPPSGWKEYCPSNSWLEQKQIQTSLEEKCLTLGVERIEKQSNLAQAEWIQDCKKAKVLKKVGKHWEVVGHHQDDEDWLFPEEALYLVEINVLELFYEGVPVSIEHAYALLLSEFHYCTLQEYRVYSYLSRKGYKLIRHAEDVRVTRYEKQIHLDQVLETQKRNVPAEISKVNSPSEQEVPKILDENAGTIVTESPVKELDNEKNLEKSKQHSAKRVVSDSEDVCIIEDNIEVIEIEDSSCKKSILNSSDFESRKTGDTIVAKNKSKILKSEKGITPECCIIIDDDEDNKDEDIEFKQETESESSEYSSEDDVVHVKTLRLQSREWYRPVTKCLIPSQIEVIDLSDDIEIKVESIPDDSMRILASKSIKDILDEMTSAGSGETFIKKPNPGFLPKEIVPKYSQYKVNLNMRKEPIHHHFLGRRQQQNYYNPNFSNNQTNNTFLGDNVLMKAYEMRAMGISMLQAASSLELSAVNPQVADPSLMNNITSLLNPTQFSNPTFTPRLFNNNMYNNNNFNNSSISNNNVWNPRNMSRNIMPRNSFSYGRRNNRFFRGYRNNSNRGMYQQKQMSRYYFKNKTGSSSLELVTIDSDDEFREQKAKRKGNQIEFQSKRSRPVKFVELIDLCEDDIPVKPEPVKKSKNKPSILTKQENIECKLEVDNGAEERLTCDTTLLEPNEVSYEKNIKIKTVVESEKEIIISEMECEDESKIKSFEKSPQISEVNLEESSQDKIDLISIQSPNIIEHSNDIEMDNEQSSGVKEVVELFEKGIENDEPTCWQQYKEQTDVEAETREEEEGPLIQPGQIKDFAVLLKNLQIFETIETQAEDGNRKLKISFDAYLPTDHFKKTLKTLPRFRIIVVNSSDSLPSNSDIDSLTSSYQDGIPFLFAIVYDDTIAFYLYDAISLPEYYQH